jgi:hypothetical protein
MAEDSGVITICLKVSFEVVRYYKTSLRSNLLRGKAYEDTRDVEHKLILGSDLEVGGGTEDDPGIGEAIVSGDELQGNLGQYCEL